MIRLDPVKEGQNERDRVFHIGYKGDMKILQAIGSNRY
jgi:hypothetical protein